SQPDELVKRLLRSRDTLAFVAHVRRQPSVGLTAQLTAAHTTLANPVGEQVSALTWSRHLSGRVGEQGDHALVLGTVDDRRPLGRDDLFLGSAGLPHAQTDVRRSGSEPRDSAAQPPLAAGRGHTAPVHVVTNRLHALAHQQPVDNLAHDRGLGRVLDIAPRDHPATVVKDALSSPPIGHRTVRLAFAGALQGGTLYTLRLDVRLHRVKLPQEAGHAAPVGSRHVELRPFDRNQADAVAGEELDSLGALATVPPDSGGVPDDDRVELAALDHLFQFLVPLSAGELVRRHVVVDELADHSPPAGLGERARVLELPLDPLLEPKFVKAYACIQRASAGLHYHAR